MVMEGDHDVKPNAKRQKKEKGIEFKTIVEEPKEKEKAVPGKGKGKVKSIPKASTPSSDEEDFKEIGGGSGQVNSEDEMEEK
uniref:Candidate secreted effector n=1 Tax=Meloidogyne incognita TaxID=6306 RepID=A0A914M961_MELIC